MTAFSNLRALLGRLLHQRNGLVDGGIEVEEHGRSLDGGNAQLGVEGGGPGVGPVGQGEGLGRAGNACCGC